MDVRFGNRANFWRFSVVAALVLLAVTGCTTAGLEERVSELENEVRAQKRKTGNLALAVTLGRASVFDPPLAQFFGAPEFWEIVYEDTGACHNKCYAAYEAALKACEGAADVDACRLQAALETVECHEECGDL